MEQAIKAAMHGLECACLLNAIIQVNGFWQRMASAQSDAWGEVFHILCQVGAHALDFSSPLRSQAGWAVGVCRYYRQNEISATRNPEQFKTAILLEKLRDLIARAVHVARIGPGASSARSCFPSRLSRLLRCLRL